MFDVTLEEGAIVEIEETDCSASSDLEVAVVTGDFDDFEAVLTAVGVGGYHAVDGQTGSELIQFLTARDELALYDAVFFAGGHLEEGIFYSTDGTEQTTVDGVVLALKAYVEEGGVLVASDWSYDVIEAIWPRRVEWVGDDLVPDAAQIGVPNTISATVLDRDLLEVVGRDRLNLDFDLDTWPVAESVDEGTTVLLSGTAPWLSGTESGQTDDSPLAITFPVGEGNVVYTPWRMETNLEGTALDVVQWIVDQNISEPEP
jgi:hypothetical protein